MGKPRDFAGKLLKNIKRAEEWKRMRGGNAGGNVYEREGNTNGRMDTNKAYYILYNVRVYVYAH